MKSVRIVLYFALAFVGLLLWNAWQKENLNRPPIINQVISQTNSVPSGLPQNALATQPTTAQPVVNSNSVTTASSNQLVTVHTDVLDIAIDPSKGTIVKASLLKYPEQAHQPQPFVLFNTDPNSFYIAQTGLTDIPDLNNQEIPFTVTQTSYQLQPGQNQIAVQLNWQSPTGLKITKTYLFKRGQYAINVSYHIDNQSKQAWQGRFYMQTQRLDAPPPSDHLVGFHTFFGVAVSSPDKPYEKTAFNKLAQEPIDQSSKGGWLAFLQHYFLTAWVPDPTQNYYYYSQANDNKVYTAGLISNNYNVTPGQQVTTGSNLYVGPELADDLQALSPHLSLTIDYGWLWIISVAIFWLMKHIYNFIGNWGWSIVIVTLLIKLAFYKLSETSYRSMAKMRALQPKIESLKEKFSDDRQQLHRATMELYSKEKVNPLGGCLPILIQIPVFIALYWVLVESVELRQAPFMLWIHDLSAPDPFYILPIIMGATMFIQQRLSPAPADPMQAKIMMFLPVFFTIFFLKFPAGLVLYWVVNNAVSILQQWYITKRFEKGAYKVKEKKIKKK